MAEFIGGAVIHLTVCFIGCILFHALDVQFDITGMVFDFFNYYP